MSDQDIIAIVVSSTGLVTVAGMLIKFTVHSVFVSLQKQIDDLTKTSEERGKEIITLRRMIDAWQEKYYKLQSEHTALQMRHEQLQRDFERMREGRGTPGACPQ